jgi:hypothetical protein
MRKESHFRNFMGPGWPTPAQLAPYFLSPAERAQIFEPSTAMGLSAEGANGTEHLEARKGRIDIDLTMTGHLFHGVHFCYSKDGGGELPMCYYSKGDLRRLREWIETQDGDLVPVGLFVPFEIAWKVVKEFIERDGALPDSNIAWIACDDVPAYAFPRLMPPQMQ